MFGIPEFCIPEFCIPELCIPEFGITMSRITVVWAHGYPDIRDYDVWGFCECRLE
jgi:hypothetical protein